MTDQVWTRRKFLKSAALTVGAFTIVPRHVLGGPGYTAPSEQLTRAVIGVGGMGRGHLRYEGARTVAVCDVDAKHLARAIEMVKEIQGDDIPGFTDFREVIERKDVDIVHVPTPPHWHALISIAAANAGKDVWCEKPMTRTIGEGKKVVEAIQRNGRMFRLNTFFRYGQIFYDMNVPVKPIKKIVENRLLGWPLRVNVGRTTGFNWKFEWVGKDILKPQSVPAELDYDMWLGPAPYKPYNEHRTHLTFRGYWDYDGGGLGDMGQHYLDPVQYFLEKDHTSPVFIEADAPQQHYDACGTWRRVYMRYADGCEIILDGEGKDESLPYIEGPKGKIWPNLRSDIPDLQKILDTLPDPEPLQDDFLNSVRTRRKFCINEEVGHRSCTMVNMAKIAVRLARPLRFDPEKQLFINDTEANRLIDEPMRAPWKI